jgi:hypothetical protein
MFAEAQSFGIWKIRFVLFVSLGGATALRTIDLGKAWHDPFRNGRARPGDFNHDSPGFFCVSRSAHLNQGLGPPCFEAIGM